MAILTSRVTAVGRYHQEFRKRVFDDVAPVDGVCVAQEFVLVNQNTTVQNLCRGRRDKKCKRERERERWHYRVDIRYMYAMAGNQYSKVNSHPLSGSAVPREAFPQGASEHEDKCY